MSAPPITAVFSPARRRVMALALSAVLVGQLFGVPYSAEPAYADAPWSTPAILSTGAGSAADPQVLATPLGDFVAVWTRTDGSNSVVEVSRLARGESLWGTPVPVSGLDQQASAPQISVASSGDLVVAWTRPEGAHSIVEASRLLSGESAWSSPTVLSDTNLDASAPQVSAVSAGDFIVVWTLSNGADDVVQARRFVSGENAWSSQTVAISNIEQDMSAPQIAADSAGNAVVTWDRANGAASGGDPNHRLSPKRIEASSSVDGGATWGSPATLVSNTRNARNSRIATGAPANFYVIWEQYDGTKWRAVTTTTSNAGSSWASSTFALSDMPVIASVPVIVADTQGNVTTAWQRKADSPNNQWLIQSRSRGVSASAWSSSATWTGVQNLAVAGTHSQQPQLTVDRAGNVTAVWQRHNGTHRIAQSSVSADAGATWTSAVNISLDGSDADDPQLAASPNGVVAAVWVTTSGGVSTIQSSISQENYSSSTVTFDANSGSGSLSDQVASLATNLSSNTLTRAGYTFAGWNTAADGSGTAYVDGASYDFASDVTLYAQWFYYPSGPQQNVPSSSVLDGGWELCWSGPYNGFAKFSTIFAACSGDYIMYTGWAGVSSSPETIPSTLPLLAAAPREDVFTATASAHISDARASNGSKWIFGDDRASDDGRQAVGFTDVQSGTPCYSGTLSICWHSAPNTHYWGGSGAVSWAAEEPGLSPGWSLGATIYLGQSPSMGTGANYTRAIFQYAAPSSNSVTFDANAGTGSAPIQYGSGSKSLNPNFFSRSGFVFSGWNTQAGGGGTAYAAGATYDFSANLTLYAQWSPVRTVTFDANGGSGSMLPDVDVGSASLPANTFTRNGFVFAGWNASADGGGVGYVDAATGVNADVTLYAQWSAVVVTFDANGGTGAVGSFAYGERASPRARYWFTRSGYRFSGWNTAADGTGTAYGEWIENNFSSDITLYAQWDTQIDCSVSGSFLVRNNVVSGGAWPYGNCSGHAEIPEGVTGIAADAFNAENGGMSLTSVGFPSTLTSIGQKAFTRASLTSAVTIPSTVTSIGNETFLHSTVPEVHFAEGSPITQIPEGFLREAHSLTAFTFPPGVTSIADHAFQNTYVLQRIEIPATVLTIGESAYEYAGTSTSATLTFEKPSSLTTIGSYGFGRMRSIESVEIPNSVVTIDSRAFLFHTSLTSLTFESPSRVETIGSAAFSYLYSLETISIPPSVRYMNGAIARMSRLTEITFEDPTLLVEASPVTSGLVYQYAPAANGPVTVNYCGDNSKLGTLEAGVTIRCDRTVSFDSNGGVGSLSSQTNYAASALSSNTFTKSGFRFMEWNTAANGSGTSYADGGSYGFSADVTLYAQWLAPYSAISGDGYVDCGTSGTFTIASNTVTGNSSCVGSVVVPPGVTAMGASSFKNATGITSVTLPAGVTTIGSYAFQTTTSMVSINIPTTVTSIGVSAFYNATALSSISLPDSVTTLGNGAFRRTLAMTTLTLGTGITSIPVSAFQESGVTSVVIPDSVTSVGGSAFYRANALESVVIGEGVTLIDSMAFMDASALQSVTLGTRVASIGVSAFANTDIGSVTLPQSLRTIDNSAFSNTPLSSITIPSEVTRIGDSAFTGATNITSLSIPDGVTTLGASAFAGMTSLTSVRIGSGVTTIPSDAFRNSGLRTITVPAGITAINSNAFADLSLLWVAFEANAPASVSDTSFANAPAGARAIVSPVASGFGLNGASWKGLSVDVQATVTFERNEGIGAMLSQRSSSSAALSNSTFVRPGYRFAGWNTQADGQGAKYLNKGLFEFSANATLYAQWVRIPAAVAAANNAVIAGVAPLAVVVRPQGIFTPVVASAERRATPQKFSRTPGPRSGASAVAMIDGEEVVVSAESTGPRNARYSAGKFTLDIGVAQSNGSVTNEGGAPALKVARGQAAEVKGGGLRPQSLLQVFLPSSDGSFLELPSVTVAEDGSFVGTLTVGMGAREKPMPIGKRFLQMVGIDEDGNDTVLEVPITVGQPLPAPEVNRLSGVRPALVPGQLVALNAGAPEVVELSTAPGAALVSGEGWAFGVTGGAQSEDSEALAFSRDAPVTFSGEGFMPGTRADVWLFSDPILLGTVNIADDGTFVADFAVDSNFVPTGDHTLQIQGVGDDGYVRAASLGVVVDDLAATPVAAVPQSPLDWIPLTLMLTSVGGLAVLVGVALAVRRRGVPRPVRVPALG